VLVRSRVDRNSVTASVPPDSGRLAGAVFGGIEVSDSATIRGSSVSGNLLASVSRIGPANVAGAGIGNLSGRLSVDGTLVVGNRATASGIGGLALGGGILNIAFFGGPPELTLTNSVIAANRLTASAGTTPHGGGLYTADPFFGGTFPVTVADTVIAGNKPDQCFGC
jgi:hypothetical protein